MPQPPIQPGEQKSEFLSRCFSYMNKHNEGEKSQRAAICYSMWRNKSQNIKKDSGDSIPQDRIFNFKVDSEESSMRVDESTGFLHCKGTFTRSGVFDYYDENMNLIRELRPEEEVFAEDSIKSLQMIPITNLHPESMVTVDNVDELLIGMVGENIVTENEYITGNMIITDKEMIETIVSRKEEGLSSELSGGYTCDVIPCEGEHPKDGHYDAIQKNIRYNHLSIVPRGRAGRNVRIMDQDNDLETKDKNKEDNMSDLVRFIKKEVKLDNFEVGQISCEVTEDSLVHFESLSDKLDEAILLITSLKKDKDELQGKLDQNDETMKVLKEDVAKLKDPNSPEIEKMVKDRKDVEDIAGKLKVDAAGKKLDDVKIECIKAISENFDAEGKSIDYINARFDAINEIVEMKQKIDDDKATGDINKDSKGGENKDNLTPKEKFLLKDAENRKAK